MKNINEEVKKIVRDKGLLTALAAIFSEKSGVSPEDSYSYIESKFDKIVDNAGDNIGSMFSNASEGSKLNNMTKEDLLSDEITKG